MMLLMKAPELDDVYGKTVDRRKLRGDELEHGERWERLTKVASELGSTFEAMHRDGHCHEAVMWFTHHLAEPTREKLAATMAIPLLPYSKHACTSGPFDTKEKALCDEYLA